MTSAQELADELDLKRRQHPVGNAFLDIARAGRLTEDHMRRLVCVEAQLHHAELPGYGLMISRFPHRPAAGLYLGLTQVAYEAGPRLKSVAESLGLPPEDRAKWMWPPGRKTYSFNGILSWLAVQGSQAVTALAAYTDMRVYFPSCREIMAKIREHGVDAPEEFTSYFESDPTGKLRPLALEVVQDGLDRGDDPREAVFMARLLEEFAADFWASAAEVREPEPGSAAGGRT
ncbi:hypothetical protein V1J52_11650 [Streptomyces sp. TRM 70351]|uniref:hypothetical protein n=1 Tax=Streptomyces sp. TRM 70351 TaxID=3116552 RepID=UPI002E7B0359|nr:hypothetical protein [Streptomyces sp. TRM 70351]MEE1928828.1 hypothetical protein [Streptomyces sp. TRM 70351]